MPHALMPAIGRFRRCLQSMAMFGCGVACLGGAAAIFDPSTLMAGSAALAPELRSFDAHQEFANSLGALIGNSQQVLAIHERGPTPYTEIVLWLQDQTNPGQVDAHEVAIVSHSQFFRTIKVHSLAPRQDAKGQKTSGGGGSPTITSSFTDHGFCDSWRSLPGVQGRIIATGISDLRITRSDSPASGASVSSTQLAASTSTTPPHMKLWLKWSADSTDGAGEATVVIRD